MYETDNQLLQTILKRSYQALFTLDTQKSSPQAVFTNASNIIQRWIYKRFTFPLDGQVPVAPRSYNIRNYNASAGMIYKPENLFLSMQTSHPDKSIPNQFWITEATIQRNGSSLLFAVTNFCAKSLSDSGPVPVSKPGFMSQISRDIGLMDVIKVQNTPRIISSQEDVDNLKETLLDSNRTLPVVVVTQVNPWGRYAGQIQDDYLVDQTRLASKLSLFAHVVTMPANFTFSWTEALGKNWSVFDGGIRVYYPGFSLQGDYRSQPLAIKDRILAASYITPEGKGLESGAAYEIILENLINRNNTYQSLPFSACKIEPYNVIFRRSVVEQRNQANKSVAEIQELYEMEIANITSEINDWKGLASSYETDCNYMKFETDDLRAEINDLKTYNERLRHIIIEDTSKSAALITAFPETYDEVPAWVKENFAGRLTLHPRAVKSIETAVYEDIDVVCKSLMLLALTYHDMRRNFVDKEQFETACKGIGVSESLSINDVGAGHHQNEYFRKYRGKDQKLDRHLVKGTSRDPRFCMRIYFFWDDEENVVVVGHLPDHLTTAAT